MKICIAQLQCFLIAQKCKVDGSLWIIMEANFSIWYLIATKRHISTNQANPGTTTCEETSRKVVTLVTALQSPPQDSLVLRMHLFRHVKSSIRNLKNAKLMPIFA